MAVSILPRAFVNSLTCSQKNHLRIIVLHEMDALKNTLGLREPARAYQSPFSPMEAK